MFVNGEFIRQVCDICAQNIYHSSYEEYSNYIKSAYMQYGYPFIRCEKCTGEQHERN